jgi:hypothetical protein
MAVFGPQEMTFLTILTLQYSSKIQPLPSTCKLPLSPLIFQMLDAHTISTLVGCLIGILSFSKLGFLDFPSISSNTEKPTENPNSTNFTKSDQHPALPPTFLQPPTSQNNEYLFNKSSAENIFLQTTLDISLSEHFQVPKSGIEKPLQQICQEPGHRRNIRKEAIFTDLQHFQPYKQLNNEDCSYILFYGDKLWSKKSKVKFDMVLKSAESLPFTQFIFVHVDNKIIANVTESTLLVFFQVQAVPQLVLTSSYVQAQSTCNCKSSLFMGRRKKLTKKVEGSHLSSLVNGSSESESAKKRTEHSNATTTAFKPFSSQRRSRLKSASRAYVQMNNLDQNELSKKLAYLVGEFQNRYWFFEKRREITVPEVVSNLNFLQKLVYNEHLILLFSASYIGMWAALNKFELSF